MPKSMVQLLTDLVSESKLTNEQLASNIKLVEDIKSAIVSKGGPNTGGKDTIPSDIGNIPSGSSGGLDLDALGYSDLAKIIKCEYIYPNVLLAALKHDIDKLVKLPKNASEYSIPGTSLNSDYGKSKVVAFDSSDYTMSNKFQARTYLEDTTLEDSEVFVLSNYIVYDNDRIDVTSAPTLTKAFNKKEVLDQIKKNNLEVFGDMTVLCNRNDNYHLDHVIIRCRSKETYDDAYLTKNIKTGEYLVNKLDDNYDEKDHKYSTYIPSELLFSYSTCNNLYYVSDRMFKVYDRIVIKMTKLDLSYAKNQQYHVFPTQFTGTTKIVSGSNSVTFPKFSEYTDCLLHLELRGDKYYLIIRNGPNTDSPKLLELELTPTDA